jgi:hypothetical protein
MARLIRPRLESTIAAGQDLIRQLSIIQQQYRYSSRVHLDTLYVQVLSTCCVNDNEEIGGKLLGTVALIEQPTTPALLAALLDLPPLEVETHLQAFVDRLILVAEDPLNRITDITHLRVCHHSLRDFIMDPLRCRVGHYLVYPEENHEKLTSRCLRLLNKHLRLNICDIHDPGLANAEILDLPARVARSVPEVLRYACLYWPVHLVGSGSVSGTVAEELLEFSAHHLLHWLEVLSLLGELSSGYQHLPRIRAWCQVSRSYATSLDLIHTNRNISRTRL